MYTKTRAGGTAILYVAVAAAILFIVLGVRQGVDRDLEQLVQSIGSDLFTITIRDGIVDDTLLAQISALPAVADVGGSTAHSQFFSRSETLMLFLVGVTSNYFRLRNLPFASGYEFEPGTTEPVAILGAAVASGLFPSGDPLGQSFDYRGHSLQVVGVLDTFPSSRGEGSSWGFAVELDNPDNLVFLPQYTYEAIVSLPIEGLDSIGGLGLLWALAAEGCLRDAMQQVSTLLGGTKVAQVRPLSARYDGLFYTRRRVATALTGIALLILLISSINVASISASAVLDRRREIGIRRALGARRHSVASLLFRETMILTLGGGVLGAILGALLFRLIAHFVGTTLYVGLFHLAFLGALVASGLLAGLLPALIGAWLDPVQAIGQRSLVNRRLFGLSPSRVMSGMAIATGVAAVIMIVALGDANVKYLKLRWLSPTSGVLRVRPGIGGFRQPADLSYDDFQALVSLEGVESAAWMASSRRTAVYSSAEVSKANLAEVTTGITDIGIGIIELGRNFSDEELKHSRPVAVLGSEVAQALFPDCDPVGEEFDLPGASSIVIGVLAFRPGLPPYDFLDMNRAILLPRGLIPLRTSPGRLWIWLRPKGDKPSNELVNEVVALMSERHPDRGQVEVIEPAAEMEALIAVQDTITRAYALLAALGLLVATTGTGSTIWLSVSLKRKEIGIRKAIGARKAQIFLQFIGEALGIALIGGLLGAAGGIVGAWLMRRSAEVRVVFDLRWALLAVGIACVIGLLASALPAYYAARSDPAATIRRGEG